MTEEEKGPVYAPELAGGEWLQGDPLSIRDSGQPVLIDFWDYTCMNCLRTSPYVREWHRRYSEHGLRIIGVHTPEFTFARNSASSGSAGLIRRLSRFTSLPSSQRSS